MKTKKILWGVISLKYKIIFKKFGKLSYIMKPLGIIINGGKVVFGDYIRVQPGLRMELLDKSSTITIGENVSIGQNVHITSGGTLSIGKNTTILGNTFITNIDHEYQDIGVPVLNQKNNITTTEIGENSFIGYGSAIQAGTRLGKQCVVGANSVVRGVFDDYSVIVGSPGKVVKKYNTNTKKWEKV
uniref:Acyltransferase n=1 Tax=Erysipelothrix tonsillarum TaxID=38402 RepID=A0A6S6I6N5_9FIRM|nr:acyltransferase [Erysipelothrix tonsillarum]